MPWQRVRPSSRQSTRRLGQLASPSHVRGEKQGLMVRLVRICTLTVSAQDFIDAPGQGQTEGSLVGRTGRPLHIVHRWACGLLCVVKVWEEYYFFRERCRSVDVK